MDRETLHKLAGYVIRNRLFQKYASARVGDLSCHPKLKTRVGAICLPNPLGVAAGFDKNGTLYSGLYSLGFGHVEVGTVRCDPHEGNPRPRIFKFDPHITVRGEKLASMDDIGLVNKMGLPSEGCLEVTKNIMVNDNGSEYVLGASVWGSDDHLWAATEILIHNPLVKYVTINVSCPNVDNKGSIYSEPIISAVRLCHSRNIPVFVKLPYIPKGERSGILAECLDAGFSGFILINTMAGVDDRGGVSGPMLINYGVEMVRWFYRATNGRYPIIGVGGINNGLDVIDYVRHGASAVQAITGFVLGGHMWPRRILKHTLDILNNRGVNSITDLIGDAC